MTSKKEKKEEEEEEEEEKKIKLNTFQLFYTSFSNNLYLPVRQFVFACLSACLFVRLNVTF